MNGPARLISEMEAGRTHRDSEIRKAAISTVIVELLTHVREYELPISR